MSQSSLKLLKRKSPNIFQISIKKIKPLVACLACLLREEHNSDFHSLMKHDKAIINKIILHYPSILNLKIDFIHERIVFLRGCGLESREIANLLKTCPGILGLSIENNLHPTMDFVKRCLGLDDSNFKKIMKKHPQILLLSLENLRSKVEYFRSIERLSNVNQTNFLARKIAISAPSTFSLSLKENIIPTVEFLGKMWGVEFPLSPFSTNKDIDYTSKVDNTRKKYSLSSLLFEYPGILTLSLESNIQPTVRFFNRTGYLQLDSQGNALACTQNKTKQKSLVRGRYISSSLFQRLLPRWYFLIDSHTFDHNNTLMPPLYILATANETAFCNFFQVDFQKYHEYKLSSVPKLKFSSQFETWVRTGKSIQ